MTTALNKAEHIAVRFKVVFFVHDKKRQLIEIMA
jgi:hypothetical protein